MIGLRSIACSLFLSVLVGNALSAAMSKSYSETLGNWEIIGTAYGQYDYVCDASFSDGKHEFSASVTYTHKNYDSEYRIAGPDGSKKSSDEEIKRLLTSPTIKAYGKGGKVLYVMDTEGSEELLMSFNRCIEQLTIMGSGGDG